MKITNMVIVSGYILCLSVENFDQDAIEGWNGLHFVAYVPGVGSGTPVGWAYLVANKSEVSRAFEWVTEEE